MKRKDELPIGKAELERHLRELGFAEAAIIELEALGPQSKKELKARGYGCPIRARFTDRGSTREIVFRTLAPDQFGHDRRADRFAQVALAFDTFGRMPKHVAALDSGAIDQHGRLISLGDGEPFLITAYAGGHLYARDLDELAPLDHAGALALARARSLALYLAELHAEKSSGQAYLRSVRDTVGSGEGIFGLTDSFPTGDRLASAARLQGIEHLAVEWRYKLRGCLHRSRRTHGDFHPFNILFREGTDFTILDASRGSSGDPADDVTALSINYAFFALVKRGSFGGAMRELWDAFWSTYLETTRDSELLEVVPLFFAWRTLVLANPLWYPSVAPGVRDRLLAFAELLLAGKRFDPAAPNLWFTEGAPHVVV